MAQNVDPPSYSTLPLYNLELESMNLSLILIKCSVQSVCNCAKCLYTEICYTCALVHLFTLYI